MKFIIIIPARFKSSRFPGKPLALLGGLTVIQRVYEKARSVVPDVYVATDDQRIYNTVKSFGGEAVMTRDDHVSGTDRIQEAVEKIGGDYDVVINLQGDEPFIQRSQIELLMKLFNNPNTQIATLGKVFDTSNGMEAVDSPNSPKVVIDKQGFALYFSRSVIPYVRGVDHEEWHKHQQYIKHLGIYAYRREVLQEITKLEPSTLEKAESLEQLRWLENGYRISVGLTDADTIGIDTPEDLQRAENYLMKQRN